jgi:hypothetical protein
MFVTDVHQLLRDLTREKFFGSVELRYEAGHIATIKKTESLKILGDEPSRFREVGSEQPTR